MHGREPLQGLLVRALHAVELLVVLVLGLGVQGGILARRTSCASDARDASGTLGLKSAVVGGRIGSDDTRGRKAARREP